MKSLFILNDAPYSSERTYNGLRVAAHLSKQKGDVEWLRGKQKADAL